MLNEYISKTRVPGKTMFWVANTATPQWTDQLRAALSRSAPQNLLDLTRPFNKGLAGWMEHLGHVPHHVPHLVPRVTCVTCLCHDVH